MKKYILLNSDLARSTLVQADELLDDAFLNILSNSIIHSKPACRPQPVEIRVEEIKSRRPKEESNIAVNYRHEISKEKFAPHVIDDFLKVSFIDHGKGIPDEVKEKVFTRYMYSSSGSGLGLSIVHALVKDRYSGDLKVRNRVEGNYNEGTIVEVTLRKWAST